MINAALVLEGGSLRSLYTAGILDFFMDREIYFSCVIGVSAGALTAANYISKQKLRTAKINILHSGGSKYYGIWQFIKNGNTYNFPYLFNDLDKIYPYNYNEVENSEQRFLICATDCETGQPIYFEKETIRGYQQFTKCLQASSSLPLIADMVEIDGKKYLDGGISEPIGISKALSEKYKKIVVISTRDVDFKRKPQSKLMSKMLNVKYRKFPNLLKSFDKMPFVYNETTEMIKSLEMDKKIFVLRPEHLVSVGRMEKDARKLINLYFSGISDVEKHLDELKIYLEL